MQRQDWLLLALSAAQGNPLSPVQLQKALFLLGEKHPSSVGRGYYHFIPYNYGPFDRLVYIDAERLRDAGLVSIEQRPGQQWNEYALTPHGMATATQLRQTAPSQAVDYLDELVPWTCSQSFESLVRAVYAEYPNMRQNSVFRSGDEPAPEIPAHTPEGEQMRRAERIRREALSDPKMLALLDQAHRLREGQECEWVTFDDLDAKYPAEA